MSDLKTILRKKYPRPAGQMVGRPGTPLDPGAPDSPSASGAPIASVDPIAAPVAGPAPAATAGKKDSDLAAKLKSSAEYLQDYKKLAEDSRFQRAAPQDSQATLREAIARAESLYTEKTDRNDWLEVAQMLSKAGAQFAAAQSGMSKGGRTGRDMSGLNFAPGVDYGARNDRAFREYSTSLRNIGDEDERAQKSYSATEKAKESNFDREKEPLAAALKQSSSLEDDDRRYKQAVDVANITSDRAEKGQAAADKRAQDRIDAAERAASVKSIEKQIDDTNKEEMDAKAGIPLVSSDLMKDMSDKSLAQMRIKHPREMGLLDPKDIEAAKKEAVEKGLIWDSMNKEKFEQAMSAAVQKKYSEKVAGLKKSLQDLRKPVGAAGAPVEDKVIVEKGGKRFKLPKSQLEQAKTEGYKLVQ